jgi:hypothetical protein
VETVTMAISAMKGRVSRVASEWEKLNSGLYQAESIGSAFVLFPGSVPGSFLNEGCKSLAHNCPQTIL